MSDADADAVPREYSIRLMTDYGARWPLWGPGAVDPEVALMPDDLRREVLSWQEFFEENFHYDSGWRTQSAADEYVQQARNLLRRLHSALPQFFIELDLWPTGDGLLASWELRDGAE